jgi:hypothetical protein
VGQGILNDLSFTQLTQLNRKLRLLSGDDLRRDLTPSYFSELRKLANTLGDLLNHEENLCTGEVDFEPLSK